MGYNSAQPAAVVARTTDFRFALAALATSPVCSLQKKLEGVEVLLSPEYRKPRRRMTARFGTAGLDGKDKKAIRDWVRAVHRLRPVAMPLPLDRKKDEASDEQLVDWLERHLAPDLRTVSKQRWLYLQDINRKNIKQPVAPGKMCSWLPCYIFSPRSFVACTRRQGRRH